MPNFNIKIKTPSGFQNFDGVRKTSHTHWLKITFDEKTVIECTYDHRFVFADKEVYAKDLTVGSFVGKFVTQIERMEGTKDFFDPINVKNGSIFNHDNGLVSHNCFLGTGNTLIDAETLLSLKADKPIKYLENGSLAIYEEVKRDHEYIMVVDVCKGLGKDFSTFSLLDITQRPIKQVAAYRNNKITPFLFPTVLVKYGTIYNNAFMIIESNDQGTLVCSGVHEMDYEELFMESTVKADKMGLLMTVKSKRLGCAGFKSMLESGKLKVVDADTIREISTFSLKGKSYEASEGNTDDLVMGLVSFGYYATTPHFKSETDIDLANMMHGQEMKEIENDMPDIGIDDGLDFIPHEPDEPYDPWSTEPWSFGDEDQGLFVEDW